MSGKNSLQNAIHVLLRIHQSYLVNFDYMKSMSNKSVLLLDGTLLQISEDRHKGVRTQFRIMAGSEISRNGL